MAGHAKNNILDVTNNQIELWKEIKSYEWGKFIGRDKCSQRQDNIPICLLYLCYEGSRSTKQHAHLRQYWQLTNMDTWMGKTMTECKHKECRCLVIDHV